MAGLGLKISTRAERAVVEVSGDLDVVTAPQLLQAILAVHGASQHDVTVDLGDVTFMDSEGLAMLVLAQEPEPVPHCPLCNGPLHQEADVFACVVAHEATPAEVIRHAELRLAEALWMAIEALDSEAMMLRLLSDSPDAVQLAADAEAQFGRRHADSDSDSLPS